MFVGWTLVSEEAKLTSDLWTDLRGGQFLGLSWLPLDMSVLCVCRVGPPDGDIKTGEMCV